MLIIAAIVIAAAFCLFTMGRVAGQPDDNSGNLFAEFYLRWLVACRDYPELNHKDCEPMPSYFGITEAQAIGIREMIQRDFNR